MCICMRVCVCVIIDYVKSLYILVCAHVCVCAMCLEASKEDLQNDLGAD